MTQNDRDLIERFGEPAGYAEVMDGRVLSIRTDRSTFCTEPLYTADRLAARLDEVERLKEALATCDDAIREYFRYFYGGEMRGSYDGKPERAQLQKAGHAASQALKGANNG